MNKLFAFVLACLVCICAGAQEDSFLSHMYLPVDAGASFSSLDGIGGAFYMRASLEYRFNVHKGFFIVGEIDTRTHPYTGGAIVDGNVYSGDAAFTDILIGPGYRVMLSDSFKLAFAAQAGASNVALKHVELSSSAGAPGMYDLKGVSHWPLAFKASIMAEYYLNPAFDLFLCAGFPFTSVPVETASSNPLVAFPTVSVGFSMALQ